MHVDFFSGFRAPVFLSLRLQVLVLGGYHHKSQPKLAICILIYIHIYIRTYVYTGYIQCIYIYTYIHTGYMQCIYSVLYKVHE